MIPPALGHTDKQAAGVQAGTTSLVSFKRNKVSPMHCPLKGRRHRKVALLVQRVEEAGESERRSVMERIGVATSLCAKAGRLPAGHG